MNQPLLADVGVPMIFIQWPLMLCALMPVIAIEAEVTRRQLALPVRKAFAGAAKANIISALAGIPLAWAIMLGVELAVLLPASHFPRKFHWLMESPGMYLQYVLGMAWMGPPGKSPWPIALAAALLLIPTFFVSVFLERRSYRRSWPDLNTVAVDRSVWYANLASYALLFTAACVWLAWLVARSRECI